MTLRVILGIGSRARESLHPQSQCYVVSHEVVEGLSAEIGA